MLSKNPTELKLSDLEELYTESEACDKKIFSEMRTNLQLVAGEHYVREGSRYWNRIRDAKQLTDEQKIRLTKNHIQRVTKRYVNQIQSMVPGVAALPKDERDMHHQKQAEMHHSVIQHWKTEGFDDKKDEWSKNFFEIGEVAVKVFWETNAGCIVGYKPKTEVDPETEEETPVLDDFGSQVPGDPVYGGQLMFETIPGFMLKRDPAVGAMRESPYLIYSKMIAKSVLRTKLDKEQYTEVQKGSSFEYTVFDTNTGTYRNMKDQVLYKEIYFRPCPMAPEGFFYHFTSSSIIAQGKLPGGHFPIEFQACESQTGNPRGISPIRHIRPCQVEYNRASSKCAEHQIVLGDDKLILSSTSRLSQGATLPGIRSFSVTGAAPTLLPGRTGDQYFPYLTMQKEELYELADMDELNEDTTPQTDIYTQLYRSVSQKKKYTIYAKRFESFLTRVTMLGLKITKLSAHEEAIIPMIGKSEVVNMAEFKSANDLSYNVKVEPRSDDIESQFGKQIVMNHVMQFAGNSLEKEDIGKLLRVSPFLNNETAFEDFTADYDSAVNEILALDRGQLPPGRPSDNHEYKIKRLNARMDKPDFDLLPPNVKNNFAVKLKEHEDLAAQKLAAIKAAEAEYIPSGGYQVACDLYVSPDPKNPQATKRVRVPSEALSWLIAQLNTQGSAIDELKTMPGNVLQDLSQRLGQSHPGQGPGPGATQPRPMGQASPMGDPNVGTEQPRSGGQSAGGGGGLSALLAARGYGGGNPGIPQ